MGKQFSYEGAYKPHKVFEPTVDSLRSGGDAVTVTLATYQTNMVTGGSKAAEPASMADGEYIGQRKVVYLSTLSDPADSVVITGANIEDTSVTLDAEDEYVLFEWDGAAWQAIYTNGTVV